MPHFDRRAMLGNVQQQFTVVGIGEFKDIGARIIK